MTGNIEQPGGNVMVRDPFGIPRRGSTARPAAPSLGEERWPLIRRASPYAHADALLETLESGAKPGVGAAWIQGTNTFVSSFAQPARALELLRRIPEIVVVDPFMSPTAVAMADLVMPPAMYPERDGIRNWWYMLAAVNRAVDPPGGMLSDMEIILETGRRIAPGTFTWGSAREWFDSILAPSGHTFESLREHGWLMPGIEYRRHEAGLLRDDGAAGFRTPSGLVELESSVMAGLGLDPLPWFSEPRIGPLSRPDLLGGFPLVLTTGARVPVMFHSENRTTEPLRRRNPHPVVDIHPSAAAAAGVGDGDWVSVESPWGACESTARLDDSLRPDTVSAQHGWWLPERQAGHPGLEGSALSMNINNLFPEGLQAPDGMGYPFRSLLCRIVSLEKGGSSRGARVRTVRACGPPPPSIRLDAAMCCGCLACELACEMRSGPAGGKGFIEISGAGGGRFSPGWAAGCDGCWGRSGGPACAANCPTGCLETREHGD
jgi:anaerobic selenocysteine-containing dehydrogenase